MDRLIGLALSSVGAILITVATMTTEIKSFELSVVFGVPMMYFGMRILVGI